MVKVAKRIRGKPAKVSSDKQKDTPVTVRLSDDQMILLDAVGREMGIEGRATVLKHCLVMRAKDLGVKLGS
jgi:hypothetical protein